MNRITFVEDQSRSISRTHPKELDVLGWLNIWEDAEAYFDGNRDQGYGGYRYDGRWNNIVDKLVRFYNLDHQSTLLDIGCAKGYLVNDYCEHKLVGKATGIDISMYALVQGKREGMRGDFFCGNAQSLPFFDDEFDLSFCKDSLHNILSESELVKSLSEIERVSKLSWVRVAAYNTDKQKKIIDDWATFATSYFSVKEWKKIFEEAGYKGDYDWFHPTDFIEDE